MVLEKTLESPLDSKGIKPVNSKGNQPRIFTGRIDAKAPKSWSFLMGRADSLEKTFMVGKIEGRMSQGQQRMRWLDNITDSMSHEFEQILGDGEGQGSLVCCSPWDCKSQTQLSN